jgi:tetratricopeptide (TPR) repeat protein
MSPDPDLKVRTALDRAALRIAGKFDRQPEVEASIRDTIGQTYLDLGLYPEARNQFERARDLHQRILGEEDPKTARSMSRVGRADMLQGRIPEAEKSLSRALEIERRVLASEHPDTLYSMTNLAVCYRKQGKNAQAEVLQSQALQIKRRVSGPEHPNTLYAMTNLADDYLAEGKFAQAETLHSQTLEGMRRVLGPEHLDSLLVMSNLATDYYAQGKFAPADALFTQTIGIESDAAQALESRRHALGSEHPETMQSAADLALAYVSQRKFAQSEPLSRENLASNQKKSPDDWQRFHAESLLGASLAGAKKYAEAEPCC